MPDKKAPFSEAIRKIKEDPSFHDDLSINRLIGVARESIVHAVLCEMEKDKEIISHVMTQRLSRPDLRGIDVYVVEMTHDENEKRRRVVPISVTGRKHVQKHIEMHPKIPVIAVSLSADRSLLLAIKTATNPKDIINLIGDRRTDAVKNDIRRLLGGYKSGE